MALGGPSIYPGTCSFGVVRTFETGATRNSVEGKHEPWGFTSALAEKRFCEYMHKHRMQQDGEMRLSDNWKKGIPVDSYKHSLSRHIRDLRLILEGYPGEAGEPDLEEVLCAVLFNVQGFLHETVKARLSVSPTVDPHPDRDADSDQDDPSEDIPGSQVGVEHPT